MAVIRDQAASVQQHRNLAIDCISKVGSRPVEAKQPGGFDNKVSSVDPDGRLDHSKYCQPIFMWRNSISASQR
jgi:hypothetical protein